MQDPTQQPCRAPADLMAPPAVLHQVAPLQRVQQQAAAQQATLRQQLLQLLRSQPMPGRAQSLLSTD
jgi:hypothetical protein